MKQDFIDIGDYWDPTGQITADSNPIDEYECYINHVRKNPDFHGCEPFTLQDFQMYIDSL